MLLEFRRRSGRKYSKIFQFNLGVTCLFGTNNIPFDDDADEKYVMPPLCYVPFRFTSIRSFRNEHSLTTLITSRDIISSVRLSAFLL